ncbi:MULTISPECIES: hypothetical protein [Saccharothrix]|uniref:hypothetical protein n=1 Tax=Saccharothrix TaxID=2071 RepID=UPI00093AAAF2|nr:hypothetical protein [Saccharothrix sp. CB00851]OKI25011.1 hypothetical protein A6A25_34065 [Saccharothrix sp. CB00851]
MSWANGQIVTNVGLRLTEGVPIDLRGSLDSQAFLAIGDSIEIMLGESHLRALRDQAAKALGDLTRIDAAEDVVGDAFHAGAQALTAAELARRTAEAARAAGAGEQADLAEQAAARAAEAAERAQTAAHVAAQAMGQADEAAEEARATATLAARAAGRPSPDGRPV